MKKIPCQTYSRVVGYYRPVQRWNDGKQQEFEERNSYLISQEESHDIDFSSFTHYEIFTMPTCSKCDDYKSTLSNIKLNGNEVDISSQNGLKKMKSFYSIHRNKITRNDDGSLALPILAFYNDNNEAHLINDLNFLKSAVV